MDITQVYNDLSRELDLGEKSIHRLSHLVQNNTDRSCFLIDGHHPVTSVSPVISGRLGTKQLIKAFKTIGLYNLVLNHYDTKNKIWHFQGFTTRCQILNIEISRHRFDKPLVFEDAVALALLECKTHIEKMKSDEIAHSAFMASEIELEPSKNIRAKLNDINALAQSM